MPEEKKKIRIGLTLEGELLKRFQAIKRKWCMEANADIIRMLITNEYDRVRKELKD